ncbi:ADAMTS-like protein 1 isoform X3 [Osmerus eperlanus]|uniref:ADAMTS-like protein 1 isoform X3 n=1 Tax=Osmerus eperlanus TaxID=29151 RepID=UPI002E123C6E
MDKHSSAGRTLLAALLILSSRTARSEEDRDTLWDAWGSWSECSRTCGGGASYSLRRCLSSRNCEGQNIKYRTCSNVDCAPDAADFRAQQCSAHADVRYDGQYHEWLPVDNDPDNPCALKCRAKASGQVVELAPKVLDGTRCYTESLDMCISGACQIVGCDHQLGSTVKEDSCGVCNGDSSSCRLVRGHYKSQHSSGKTEDQVIVIPYGSRHVRLVLKGPDHLYVESKTLQGGKGELALAASGQYHLENTTLDFQKLSDKQVLRITGPLGADFSMKVRFTSGVDSVVQFIFYQPIVHRWRETDFFPCSVTCGGGYQLTSAECFDQRSQRVVMDQYCHYYPENVKPKPKLQECNMDPCLASDGYKQILPYDLYHPLPRWENSPWTACSTSCGGGIQSRSVSCVEEDLQGSVTASEEWKCLYAPKTAILQPCNAFDCPTWSAQDWSPCTTTCGQGLRYRVVLCIDHRGLHAGGCNPTTKPHIKEECLITVPCFKPIETLPVEAKQQWAKQAIELEEEIVVSEDPTFIPSPWLPCSRTCGTGTQRRTVRCQVLLSFSQTVADLPDHECQGPKPAESQPCYHTPCPGVEEEEEEEEGDWPPQKEELHDWEMEGFSECSRSCGTGLREAVWICLNKQTREAADESQCVSSDRPPRLLQSCSTQHCPPRWEAGQWTSCSATCGVGLMTRSVVCVRRPSPDSNQTERVRDEECRAPKPNPLQACNRFDCPPMWDLQDWGQCSRSCGGGAQTREVLCKQRLSDGSVLELPDTFCPKTSPPSQQPCGLLQCPAQWVTTSWSQCSVTCGEGLQRRHAACRRPGEGDQYQAEAPQACAPTPQPSTARPCSPGPCQKPSRSDKTEPGVQAQRKVYIQLRRDKKLHAVAGGYAYLLPWTSVQLRCPARLRGGHTHWLKDGKPLAVLPHLGDVHIQHLRASDAGVYTCVAGQAQENLVLKVISSKQKVNQLAGNSAGDRTQEVFRYDTIVQLLLNQRGASQDSAGFTEDKNRSTQDRKDAASETYSPSMLVVETQRLDDFTHNLSKGLEGREGEQAIARLLAELSGSQDESNESILQPSQRPEFSVLPGARKHTFKDSPHSSRARGPVPAQRPRKVAGSTPSAVVVRVGTPVVLHRQVSSVELKCEVSGGHEPTVTWTKDGKEILYSGRVALQADGSLKILSPGQADTGLYTCSIPGHLGSSSLASWLHVAGERGGNCSNNIENSSLCPDRGNNSRSHCHGQACPLRWLASPWSLCSASCGGGVQSRRVSCLSGPERGASRVAAQRCVEGAGRRPGDRRPCNTLPCVRWAASGWGPCQGHCVGLRLATQHRHISCQDLNATKVSHRMCSDLHRPSSCRNCSSEACALQWRVGPWTQCTASCGRHGFQSRHVTCAHLSSGKAAQEHHCTWRPRPSSWQRCNILSCGKAGECLDSSRYCEKVRQLDLCLLPQFKTRCCQSCQDT